MNKLKRLSPVHIIVLGFVSLILIGTFILLLPLSHNDGVIITFIDALFTATSAVCVTGLTVVNTTQSYSAFGKTIIALLIQIGGLGVATVGVGVSLVIGQKIGFNERKLINETYSLNSMKGIVNILRFILYITLVFESIGAILCFTVFIKDYPPIKALGTSLFHSISSFNNAGFDILENPSGLEFYQNNILLNLITVILIVFGGLGFRVIREIFSKRKFKRLSLHAKIVITTTVFLLIAGTITIKFNEDINWIGALFYSGSARTAGFSTYSLGDFSSLSLFTLILLMYIGASPGSTGGGIKTTTIFTALRSSYCIARNRHITAFKRKIPNSVVQKSFMLVFISVLLICIDTFIIMILEPNFSFLQILFEVVSAFATVGLSTGITAQLSILSKILIIITMFVGRLGPLTIISLLAGKQLSNVFYSEESYTIG